MLPFIRLNTAQPISVRPVGERGPSNGSCALPPSIRYVAAAYEISGLSLRPSRGIGFGFDITSLPNSTHGYSVRILIQRGRLNLIRHHGGRGLASGTRNVFDL